MSIVVSPGIVFSLVVTALAATPLGCTPQNAPEEDAVAAASADSAYDQGDLATAVGLDAAQQAKLAQVRTRHHHHVDGGSHYSAPSIDQIVQWLTKALDLSPEQVEKLRTFLEARAQGGGHSNP